jgi:hypothetical protein
VQEKCFYLTFFTTRQILAFFDYFTSEKLDKEKEEECETLIRFVNTKAQLPPHKNFHGILHKFNDHFEIFCEIGSELQNIFRDIPKQPRKLKDVGQHDIITKGRLFVAAYTNKSQFSNLIMSLYAYYGYYPEPWQILICTSSTTIEELTIFIKRSFYASDNGYNNHLFCIINLESLDFELQYFLVSYIKTMQLKYASENFLLALLCCQKTGRSNYILDYYLEVQEINELDAETLREVYQELFTNITCVSSDLSGQGKTEWIKEASYSKQKIPLSFLISDNMDLKYLVNKLKACKLKQIQSLHINILSADYPEEVNVFLFELLVFNLVSYNNKEIVSIPEILIFIEISSSIKQNLLAHLPILKFPHHKYLSWNIKNFRVSQEATSSVQVVCQFLKLYDLGKIDTKEIFVQTPESIKDLLSEEICQYLIMKYFLNENDENDKNISSFKYIEIFVNILSDQLIRFSLSQYFTINNLKSNLKETNIRSTIIKSLISTSKDFITQSIKAKTTQLRYLTPEYEFDNSNSYILFLDSQTSNSFSVYIISRQK